MSVHRHTTRRPLSHAALSIVALAALSAVLVAGCGSGSSSTTGTAANVPSLSGTANRNFGNGVSVPVGSPSATSMSAASVFSGRAYTAQVALAGTQRATINLQTGSLVQNVSQLIASLIVEDLSKSAPLARRSGRAVIATPTLSGTVEGQTGAIRLSGSYTDANGVSQAVSLTGSLPSATSTGAFTLTIGTQSYSGTFALGTTLPATSPSPLVSPSPTASLTAQYFPLHTDDTYTYTSQDGTSSSGYTQTTGNAVTFSGNPAYQIKTSSSPGGVIDIVDYVNALSDGYHYYGTDEINNGTTSTTLQTPSLSLPVRVFSGQVATLSFQSAPSGGGAVTSSETGTITPQGTTSVTVPAGTFNALQLLIHTTRTASPGTAGASTSTSDVTLYLAPNVGLVKSITIDVNGTNTSTTVLKSAVVNGVKYGQ